MVFRENRCLCNILLLITLAISIPVANCHHLNSYMDMYFCYPEFWGKYDRNRRNKLITESIFIRSTCRAWLPLRSLSQGSLIIVIKVKSRKQIGKNFCSFLFMLNFGNQFPFRILFRILLQHQIINTLY
jgi:hypothetical protein